MTKQETVEHFKTQGAVAAALGIKQSSVAEWGDYPPPLRQIQLHRVTAGQLRAEPEVIEAFGEPVVERTQ